MRKEASIEQWKTLYEAGTRIKELKPWGNKIKPKNRSEIIFGAV